MVALLGTTQLGSDPCTLQLPPNTLRSGTRYLFQLDAFLPSGISARAGIVLTTADPPLGGELRVYPPSGVAMTTDFTLSCYYWTAASKEDLPLFFQFQVRTVTEGQGELVQSIRRRSRHFQVCACLSPMPKPFA